MRTSCIEHPAGEPLILAREWQLKACKGDHCAAFLLSFLEFWHNNKIAAGIKAKQANDVAERHGDTRTQNEGLWQFHTIEELKAGLLGLYSDDKIRTATKDLEKLGFIQTSKNPNPRYKFDATKFFLVNSVKINEWLKEYKKTVSASDSSSENNRESVPKNREREPINPQREPENRGAIPEYNFRVEQSENTSSLPEPDGSEVEEVDKSKVIAERKRVDPLSSVQNKWNSLPAHFPKVRVLSSDRRKSIQARLKEDGWMESLDKALEKVAASDFCNGVNDRGWVADLDWFIRPGTVDRILEGKHDNRTPAASTPQKPAAPKVEIRPYRERVEPQKTREQEEAELAEMAAWAARRGVDVSNIVAGV